MYTTVENIFYCTYAFSSFQRDFRLRNVDYANVSDVLHRIIPARVVRHILFIAIELRWIHVADFLQQFPMVALDWEAI